MHPFTLERPRDLAAALALRAQAGRNDAPIEYIAGGTDMVQLLQEYVRRPERLVSLAGLLDNRIDLGPQGLRLSAAATMAEVAAHPGVVEQFPLISEALLESASPQVRNQATIGGNRLQRTRCPYFRDIGYEACNKRTLGSGCAALGGENRWHAVLGTSANCIAAHASDLAVALVALDAVAEVRGAGRQRSVSLSDFYRLPEDAPHIETVIEPGEVISAITVPANPAARRSRYLKVARPCLIRVCARVGRGGARHKWDAHPACADCTWRGRDQALARFPRRGSAGWSGPGSDGAPLRMPFSAPPASASANCPSRLTNCSSDIARAKREMFGTKPHPRASGSGGIRTRPDVRGTDAYCLLPKTYVLD